MAQKFAIPAFFGNPISPAAAQQYNAITAPPLVPGSPAPPPPLAGSLVVINLDPFQDTHPFPSPIDPNLVTPFNTLAQTLQASGYIVLAYVDTDMGTGAACPGALRPPAVDCGYLASKPFPNPDRTEAMITPYIDFLYQAIPRLDGIFFDQGPAPYCFTGGPTINAPIAQCVKDFYSHLYQYVKTKPVRPGRPAVGGSAGAAVLLNASQYEEDPGGSWIIAGPYQSCDVAILWETAACLYFVAAPFVAGNPTNVWPTPLPSWWQTLPSDRISHTIFACHNADDMRRVIELSAHRGPGGSIEAGYVFVIDSDGSNYDHLPSYWRDELAAVAGMPPTATDVQRSAATHLLYVRDWTDTPTLYDTGNPSLNHSFVTTGDVWNRNTNTSGSVNPPSPVDFPPNDQPPNEDPRVGASGTGVINYAFARVKRQYPCVPDTDEMNVTAHFLWADFGVGTNFMDVGPSTATSSYTFGFAAGQVPPIVSQIVPPNGLQWTLPATASPHICIAVELSSPNDPLTNELLGLAAGSATDAIVRDDRKVAQRNLTTVRVAASPKPLPFSCCAIAHNSDLFPRKMVLRPNLAETSSSILSKTASIAIIDRAGKTTTTPCRSGTDIVLDEMQPGENRWICLAAELSEVNDGRLFPVTFDELSDGRRINGFTIVVQPAPLKLVIQDALRLQAVEFRRYGASFDGEGAKDLSAAALSVVRRGPLSSQGYVDFLRSQLHTIHRVLKHERHDAKDPFGVQLAVEHLTKAAELGDVDSSVARHSQLLHKVGAWLTFRQKEAGDVSDILQMVRWQKQLYTSVRRLVEVQGSRRLSRESEEFIGAFRSRRLGAQHYSALLRSLQDVFHQTAEAASHSDLDLKQAVKAISDNMGSLTGLQRAHRDYLLKIQRL